MRNKTNEVTDFSEIVDIISRCDTIRIAMFDDPYSCFVYIMKCPCFFGHIEHCIPP